MKLQSLQPFDRKKGEWRVVVETPKGSRNKYKFDDELGTFILNGVLPEGMSIPYDFGFLPGTRAEDGDPVDVLVLMDEPAFCGCIVPSRVIGVIEAEQSEKNGQTERNDRLVAVSTRSRDDRNLHTLKNIDRHRLKEIQEFFVSYNRVKGKKFKVLNIGGPKKAEALAKQAMRTAGRTKKRKAI